MNTNEAENEKYIDSLGQENPAVTMEKANVEAARERTEKSEAEAKEAIEPEVEPTDYESMTVAELKELAEDRGVHIAKDMRKDEIIKALESA